MTVEHIPPLQESTKARLLIVDDEPNIRSALVRALSLKGYSVDDVGSGHEALALLDRKSYDLMVLDMRMPGMDGVAVMHRAHQLYPELLIIVLTGHATLESAITAIKSEVVDYLQKPAGAHEIIDTVIQALHKRAEQLHRQHLVSVVGQAVDALRQAETGPTALPPLETNSEHFVHGHPLTLDRQRCLVMIDGDSSKMIHLTKGETSVLDSLMSYPNQALSCSQLVYVAWGYKMDEREAQVVIRPHISRLRRKVEAILKEPRLIQTVRGLGYLFTPIKKQAPPSLS